MRTEEFEPVYVELMPENIEHSKLYISEKYKVSIHLCACGCGVKAVCPIKDTEWKLTNLNGKVSLNPSIGNWSGEPSYHAHYYITENKVIWC